jgi:hypothetical protein
LRGASAGQWQAALEGSVSASDLLVVIVGEEPWHEVDWAAIDDFAATLDDFFAELAEETGTTPVRVTPIGDEIVDAAA